MPPKGKPATKGQKQIAEENTSTLSFYTYVIFGANAIYFLMTLIFFFDSYTAFYMFLTMVTSATYFGTFKFLNSMGRATYDGAGTLLDGGIDLNMESGMAEHAKDIILLTAIVQILSLISNYFWLLILLAPGRAFYLLWVHILAPWIFAPPPEVDEKKQKKKERKLIKHR